MDADQEGPGVCAVHLRFLVGLESKCGCSAYKRWIMPHCLAASGSSWQSCMGPSVSCRYHLEWEDLCLNMLFHTVSDSSSKQNVHLELIRWPKTQLNFIRAMDAPPRLLWLQNRPSPPAAGSACFHAHHGRPLRHCAHEHALRGTAHTPHSTCSCLHVCAL